MRSLSAPEDTEFQANLKRMTSEKLLDISHRIAILMDDSSRENIHHIRFTLKTLADIEAAIRLKAFRAEHMTLEPTADQYPLYWMNALAEIRLKRKLYGNRIPVRMVGA